MPRRLLRPVGLMRVRKVGAAAAASGAAASGVAFGVDSEGRPSRLELPLLALSLPALLHAPHDVSSAPSPRLGRKPEDPNGDQPANRVA